MSTASTPVRGGMARNVALVLMAVAGLSCVVVGLRYLTATEFTPGHAQLAGRQWGQIDAAEQALLLCMLKVVGAGFAGCGAALLAFAAAATGGARWPAVAAGIVTLVVWMPTLFLTMKAEHPVLATMPCVAVLLLSLSASVLLWMATPEPSPRSIYGRRLHQGPRSGHPLRHG